MACLDGESDLVSVHVLPWLAAPPGPSMHQLHYRMLLHVPPTAGQPPHQPGQPTGPPAHVATTWLGLTCSISPVAPMTLSRASAFLPPWNLHSPTTRHCHPHDPAILLPFPRPQQSALPADEV